MRSSAWTIRGFVSSARQRFLRELIEREDIRPAPYVGRYKWVMLDRLDAVRWDELRELIRQSYEMVAAKAPKKKPGRKREASKSVLGRRSRRVEEEIGFCFVDRVGGQECPPHISHPGHTSHP